MDSRTAGFLKLAPDVGGLDALGARGLDDLFGDPPSLLTGDRARPLGTTLRLPLPGTPDESGRQREKPRGAGTGYLFLRRYPAGGVDGLRARLLQPRSSSCAARDWNLICHLQAHGLSAPQLVALAERGARPFGAESVLVTRELEGFVTLRAFLERRGPRAERRRALKSLALAFAQLLRCGAWLPRLSTDNVLVQEDDNDCVALRIVNLQTEQTLLRERGLARSRLPAIAFTQFERGRILPRISARRRDELVAALARDAGAALSRRERLELLVRLGYTRTQAELLAARCEA